MSFNYSSGIRIRKGTEKSHIGRVEIKDEGGEWKTICDQYWTKENAITVMTGQQNQYCQTMFRTAIPKIYYGTKHWIVKVMNTRPCNASARINQ